jgi:hypothetical protein
LIGGIAMRNLKDIIINSDVFENKMRGKLQEIGSANRLSSFCCIRCEKLFEFSYTSSNLSFGSLTSEMREVLLENEKCVELFQPSISEEFQKRYKYMIILDEDEYIVGKKDVLYEFIKKYREKKFIQLMSIIDKKCLRICLLLMKLLLVKKRYA